MRENYMTVPITITVIFFLILSTAVVYVFDIIGKPIWDSPHLIPLMFLIPFVLSGWFPLVFYGMYLNRHQKSSTGNILIVIAVIWVISILIAIGCTIKSVVILVSEHFGF